MQKLRLNPVLTHRLSPQKLQLIKLLQVPSSALKARIEQELASNPALEEGDNMPDAQETREERLDEEVELPSYPMETGSDPIYAKYRTQDRDWLSNQALSVTTSHSLSEHLLRQLGFLQLDERERTIGTHLIGTVGQDGYLRRDLEAIVNDLAFTQYLETTVQEVEAVLKKIQQDFDPPGVAARSLQECLLLQLKRSKHPSAADALALKVLARCFELFTKKHYLKISEKLGIEDATLLQEALSLITRLDPKPGSRFYGSSSPELLHPDFIVKQQDGELQVMLARYTTPPLRTSKRYTTMLAHYKKHAKQDPRAREAASFVKKRLEAAQWFMEAVRQRQHTLLNTMRAIVKLQRAFFMEEDERLLRPMVLKLVAEEIGMDVSTAARIVNNKSVQTDFGIYPLKFFFTKAIVTTSGEEVSNKTVKKAIEALIKREDKQHPYADEKIATLLKAEGYPIARRTVTKYREQLRLPVARLRRSMP